MIFKLRRDAYMTQRKIIGVIGAGKADEEDAVEKGCRALST